MLKIYLDKTVPFPCIMCKLAMGTSHLYPTLVLKVYHQSALELPTVFLSHLKFPLSTSFLPIIHSFLVSSVGSEYHPSKLIK